MTDSSDQVAMNDETFAQNQGLAEKNDVMMATEEQIPQEQQQNEEDLESALVIEQMAKEQVLNAMEMRVVQVSEEHNRLGSELEETRNKLKDLLATSSKQDAQKLAHDLELSRQERDRLYTAYTNAREHIQTLEKSLSSAQAELSKCDDSAAAVMEEKCSLALKLSETTALASELSEKEKVVSARYNATKTALEQAQRDLMEKSTELAELKKTYTETTLSLKRNRDSAQQKSEVSEQMVTQLRAQITELQNALSQRDEEVVALRTESRKNQEMMRTKTEFAEQMVQVQKNRADVSQKRIEELQKSVSTLRERNSQNVKALQAAAERETALKSEIAEHEQANKSLIQRLESAKKKLEGVPSPLVDEMMIKKLSAMLEDQDLPLADSVAEFVNSTKDKYNDLAQELRQERGMRIGIEERLKEVEQLLESAKGADSDMTESDLAESLRQTTEKLNELRQSYEQNLAELAEARNRLNSLASPAQMALLEQKECDQKGYKELATYVKEAFAQYRATARARETSLQQALDEKNAQYTELSVRAEKAIAMQAFAESRAERAVKAQKDAEEYSRETQKELNKLLGETNELNDKMESQSSELGELRTLVQTLKHECSAATKNLELSKSAATQEAEMRKQADEDARQFKAVLEKAATEREGARKAESLYKRHSEQRITALNDMVTLVRKQYDEYIARAEMVERNLRAELDGVRVEKLAAEEARHQEQLKAAEAAMHVSSYESQIALLRKENEQLMGEVQRFYEQNPTDLMQQLHAAEEKAAQLSRECADTKENLQRAESSLSMSSESLQHISQSFEQFQKEAKQRAKESDDAVERLTQALSSKDAEHAKGVADLKERLSKAEENAEKYTTECTELRQTCDSLKQSVDSLKSRNETLDKEFTTLHSDYTAAVQAHALALSDLEKMSDDLVAAKNTAAREHKERVLAQEQFNELQSRFDVMKQNYEQTTLELENKIVTLSGRYETVQQQAAIATERAQKAERLAQTISNGGEMSQPSSANTTMDGGGDANMDVDATTDLEKRVALLQHDNTELLQREAELKASLLKERERAAAITEIYKGVPSATEYKDLEMKARQLSLFRESNETLRRSAQLTENKLDEVKEELKKMKEEWEALKDKTTSLSAENETLKKELTVAKEERATWQKRMEDIVVHSHVVDLTEYERVKAEYDRVKAIADNPHDPVLEKKVEDLEKSLEIEKRRNKIIQQRVQRLATPDTASKILNSAPRNTALQQSAKRPRPEDNSAENPASAPQTVAEPTNNDAVPPASTAASTVDSSVPASIQTQTSVSSSTTAPTTVNVSASPECESKKEGSEQNRTDESSGKEPPVKRFRVGVQQQRNPGQGPQKRKNPKVFRAGDEVMSASRNTSSTNSTTDSSTTVRDDTSNPPAP